jgi:hypothetical protein
MLRLSFDSCCSRHLLLKSSPAGNTTAFQSTQVFVLWVCFLGLQLGKSRFPRCSAPYFSIFAVQVGDF